MQYLAKRYLILLFCFLCTTKSALSANCYDIYDPYEGFNRSIFHFNDVVDKMFFKPPTKAYYKFVPVIVQDRLAAVFSNLREPLSTLNSALQGDGENFGKHLFRFIINSSLGILGLVDVATAMGIEAKRTTFSNTFMHYNASYGFYLVIPIIGPSTTREGVGKVLDLAADPVSLALWDRGNESMVYTIAGGFYTRIEKDETLEKVEELSVDYYTKMRSFYLHNLAFTNPNCKDKEDLNYDELPDK